MLKAPAVSSPLVNSLINQFYPNHEQFSFSQSPLNYASDFALFVSWAV